MVQRSHADSAILHNFSPCRAAAPGEPPFCKEGDRVKKGQTVCIIEAMKLMNEIEVGFCGV
jgi:acetyl-CoA carboxylase biotin carboxyl carrier protein